MGIITNVFAITDILWILWKQKQGWKERPLNWKTILSYFEMEALVISVPDWDKEIIVLQTKSWKPISEKKGGNDKVSIQK